MSTIISQVQDLTKATYQQLPTVVHDTLPDVVIPIAASTALGGITAAPAACAYLVSSAVTHAIGKTLPDNRVCALFRHGLNIGGSCVTGKLLYGGGLTNHLINHGSCYLTSQKAMAFAEKGTRLTGIENKWVKTVAKTFASFVSSYFTSKMIQPYIDPLEPLQSSEDKPDRAGFACQNINGAGVINAKQSNADQRRGHQNHQCSAAQGDNAKCTMTDPTFRQTFVKQKATGISAKTGRPEGETGLKIDCYKLVYDAKTDLFYLTCRIDSCRYSSGKEMLYVACLTKYSGQDVEIEMPVDIDEMDELAHLIFNKANTKIPGCEVYRPEYVKINQFQHVITPVCRMEKICDYQTDNCDKEKVCFYALNNDGKDILTESEQKLWQCIKSKGPLKLTTDNLNVTFARLEEELAEKHADCLKKTDKP